MLFLSPPKRTRLLAFFLLAAFAWGTTAELNHHHAIKARSGQALLSAAQDSIVSKAASVQVESEGTSGTSSSSKNGAACLICQLHQNLSSTLFSEPPGVGSTETHLLNANAAVVVQLYEYRANRLGRAPPIDSLS
jgi:hypothetical protein